MGFVQQYFTGPIYDPSGAYNLVNTTVYALVAIVALYGLFKILRRFNVVFDGKFFLAVVPFIFFGSSLRAFVDSEIYGISFWTVSPGIYILTAGIFIAALFLSLGVERFLKVSYWKSSIAVGGSILAVHFGLVADSLQPANLPYALAMLGLAVGISLALFFAFKYAKFSAGKENFAPFPAHMLDAATTFIAVDFLGAIEKHPLPALSSSVVGTAAIMFPLKLLVLVPLVHFLNKEFEDKQVVNYFIIAVAVLGLAEGLRNLLTVLIA
jgi:uncharacterized membrane protein